MAEADNIARLIAAGSAVGTACNMAVSYANYRRKRPKAKLAMTVERLIENRGEQEVVLSLLEMRLRNLSESPNKIVSVELQQSYSRLSNLRYSLWQLRTHRGLFRPGFTTDLKVSEEYNWGCDEPGELPWTLTPLQGLKWRAVVDAHPWCASCTQTDLRQPIVRVRLRFPGGEVVSSRWLPITEEMRTSTCLMCLGRSQGLVQQLSFDDI
ncbi:hypothetical protein [Streptomyces sp. NPDC052207]|uniref:hypothetical protein n=1 Tax=Streptomyces sp. NPDC052207 TaxID=3155418 RepID=UPI0034247491